MTAQLDPADSRDRRFDGQAAASLRTAFERQVLQGLRAEWENARWRLPSSLRQSVRCPLFSIRDMRRRLGSWHPERREITLSREMVSRHRWDDVKDVLLHEMAHQVAHESLGATAEQDHGAAFRKACQWLRANPAASGNYLPLSERLRRGEAMDEQDRIVVKVSKLLALAESSNPNEAKAAMQKAYVLIARHNLRMIDRGTRQHYASIFLGKPRLRHFREAYHLALLLQDFYFVQGVWVQSWVLEKGRMGRVLEISGTPKNVLIAEYVHDAVGRYIDKAWAAYTGSQPLNRSRKTDFAIGIIEGFKTTLLPTIEEIRAGNDGASHLPAKMTDPVLRQYVAKRYGQLRSFSRQGPGHDPRVLADGTETGKKLVIAKGITQMGENRDLRLPPPKRP